MKKTKIKIYLGIVLVTIALITATLLLQQPKHQVGKTQTASIEIRCDTLVGNQQLDAAKQDLVPSNGIILAKCDVTFTPGQTVFDVLKKVVQKNNLQFEFSTSLVYDSVLVEGIANLYQFDAGGASGWQYRVNGQLPMTSCSKYVLNDGDVIQWDYTCQLGADLTATQS